MSFHPLECRTWRSGAGQAIQLHIHRNSLGPFGEGLDRPKAHDPAYCFAGCSMENLSLPFGWRNVGLRQELTLARAQPLAHRADKLAERVFPGSGKILAVGCPSMSSSQRVETDGSTASSSRFTKGRSRSSAIAMLPAPEDSRPIVEKSTRIGDRSGCPPVNLRLRWPLLP